LSNRREEPGDRRAPHGSKTETKTLTGYLKHKREEKMHDPLRTDRDQTFDRMMDKVSRPNEENREMEERGEMGETGENTFRRSVPQGHVLLMVTPAEVEDIKEALKQQKNTRMKGNEAAQIVDMFAQKLSLSKTEVAVKLGISPSTRSYWASKGSNSKLTKHCQRSIEDCASGNGLLQVVRTPSSANLARDIASGKRTFDPCVEQDHCLRAEVTAEAQHHETGLNRYYTVTTGGIFYVATSIAGLVEQALAASRSKGDWRLYAGRV